MRIFMTTWFKRFSRREALSTEVLKAAVGEMAEGKFNADLGGGIYKQRIAREGGGKSGGYRVIVCFRRDDRTFFMYGFPKSSRENITTKELRAYRKTAQLLLSLSEEQLGKAIENGVITEIE